MKTGDDVDFAVLKAAVDTIAEELGKMNHRLEQLEQHDQDSVFMRRVFVAAAMAAGNVQRLLTEHAAGT